MSLLSTISDVFNSHENEENKTTGVRKQVLQLKRWCFCEMAFASINFLPLYGEQCLLSNQCLISCMICYNKIE